MRPLFTGIDFNFLSSLSWTTRLTASSSSAKSKGRGSDLINDPESGLGEEGKRMRWPSERCKRDIELSGFEQVVNAGTPGDMTSMERAASLKTEDSWLENSSSGTVRIRIESSFV